MAEKNSGFLETQTFTLITSKAPVISPVVETVNVQKNLQELFDETGFCKEQTKITVNNVKVEDWSIVPSANDVVAIQQTPADPTGGFLTSILATAGAAYGFMWLGYKMYKPDLPTESEEVKENRIRGSRNSAEKYKPVPFVLGKRRISPPFAALPYSYWNGNNQSYKVLLCAGYGPLKIEDIRIGDIPITEFTGAEVAVLDWYQTTSIVAVKSLWGLDIIQNNISTEIPQIEKLAQADATLPLVTQSPAGEETSNVSLSIVWPRGIIRITQTEKRRSLGGCVMVTYKDKAGKTLCAAKYGTDFYTNGSLPYQVWKIGELFYLYGNDVEAGDFKHDGRHKTGAKLQGLSVYVVDVDETNNVVILDYDAMVASGNPDIKTVASVSSWASTEQLVQNDLTFKPYNAGSSPITFNIKNITPQSPTGGADSWFANAELFTISRQKPLDTEAFYRIIGMPNRRSYPSVRPVIVAIDIKASEQLSDTLDNINMLATSVVPLDDANYNTDWRDWFKTRSALGAGAFEPTENPAKLYKWLLQGPMNSRPVPISKIDTAALRDWGANCANNTPYPWRCSQYFNFESPLKTALNNVASTGRAEFSMKDGKFSVVERIKKTIPTQMFTPKNSRNFSSKRNFPEKFDGIEFEFDNEELNHEKDSGIVYDPLVPVNEYNGTFTKLQLWGIPSGEIAQRHARFSLLEEKLRRETYELTTDIEGLVAQRGDLVRIANDIIDVGIGQGFITSVSGNNFSIDETKDLVDATVYAIQVRNVDTGTKFRTFNATYNGNGQWTSTTPLPAISVKDLVVYGKPGLEVLDAIVLEVKYSNDYEATLTLANAANVIYDLDGSFIPPYQTNLTPRPENILPTAPVLNVTGSDALQREPFATVSVTNIDKIKSSTKFIRLQYASSTEQVESEDPSVDSTLFWQTVATQAVDQPIFKIPVSVESGINHYFRAQALGSGNLASNWSNVASIIVASNSVANVADYKLGEFKNLPPTPGGYYNTVVVTYTAPSDPNFNKAIIEYRPSAGGEFVQMNITETDEGRAGIEVFTADGKSYLFRIRSVSKKGIVNDDGVEFVYKTTNTLQPVIGEDEKPEENLNVPNVTGLELFEQGNDTDFTGRDAKFGWNKTNLTEWVNLGLEGLKGASATSLSEYFRDYEVTVYNASTGEIRRTEYVTDNFYTYTWEKNYEDSQRLEESAPLRQFGVSVVMRSRQNGRSPKPAKLVVQNPAPELPVLVTSPGYNFILIKYNQPTDPDWIGTKFWISTISGFVPDPADPAFNGPDTTVMLSGLDAGTTYYIRWQPYDAFGAGTMADEFAFATVRLNSRDLDETPPSVPTNLVITTGVEDAKLYTMSWVKLEWDASTDPDDGIVAGYFVERWDNVDTTPIQQNVANLTYRLTDAKPGRTYYMRVAAQDWAGNTSAFSTTASIVAAGDLSAPSNATSLTATAGLDKVILSWVNPSDDDFLATKVYRGTTAGFTPSDATNLITTVPGEKNKTSSIVDANVANGTTYYYKTVTVDVSGNESAASVAVSGTPFTITSVNIDSYMADNALLTSKIPNGAIVSDKIDTSAITETKIAANAITTPKIAVNAVDADRIAANAVVAGKIAANAVTANEIAAGTITGDRIAANQITAGLLATGELITLSAQIKDGIIENAKISNLDAGKITTGDISAARMSANFLATAQATVGQLSAITADVGTLSAGTLVGLTYTTSLVNPNRVTIDSFGITGYNTSSVLTFNISTDGSGQLGAVNPITWNQAGTITVPATLIAGEIIGKTIKTAASGWRVELDSSGLRYTDGVNETVDIYGSGAFRFGPAGSSNYISWDGSSFTIAADKIGSGANNSGSFSVALGSNSSATGSSTVAVGQNSTASGNDSVAVGRTSTASGSESVAVGVGATSLLSGVAVGRNALANATGGASIAVGNASQAYSLGGIAIGFSSRSWGGTSNVAIGGQTLAGANGFSYVGATALGSLAEARQTYDTAIGYDATAISSQGTSIGYLTNSAFQSVAVGSQASSAGNYAISVGCASDATIDYNIALGYNAQSTGNNASIAIGPNSIASANNSVAIGSTAVSSSAFRIILGTASHSTTVPGSFSVTGAKSFQIPHPTKENYYLRHSAIESPTAGDNLYRYQIETTNNSATIHLPEYFSALNKDVQVFVSPEKNFGAAYGEVVGNVCTITSNQDGLYNVLIIGTRQDPAVSEWDIFGAEAPMTDNEIEANLAEIEDREPVLTDSDTYNHVTDEIVKTKCQEMLSRKNLLIEKTNNLVQRRQERLAEKQPQQNELEE